MITAVGEDSQEDPSSSDVENAANAAGLNPEGTQKLSFHDLRHSAISHLIRANPDPVTVSRFAGHSKTSVTLDVYAHEFQNRAGEGAGAALGAVLGGVL